MNRCKSSLVSGLGIWVFCNAWLNLSLGLINAFLLSHFLSQCLFSQLWAPASFSLSPFHPALSRFSVYGNECTRMCMVDERTTYNLACQSSPSTLTQGLSVLHWCLCQADCPAAFQEISRLRLPSLGRGLRDSRHLYCCVQLLCPF